MSRSYRAAWYIDGYGTKRKRDAKREANRRVRRAKDVPNGRAYRKYFDPWNICEYRFQYNTNPKVIFFGECQEVILEPIWKVTSK